MTCHQPACHAELHSNVHTWNLSGSKMRMKCMLRFRCFETMLCGQHHLSGVYPPAAHLPCATSGAVKGLSHCIQSLTAYLANKHAHCVTMRWHVLRWHVLNICIVTVSIIALNAGALTLVNATASSQEKSATSVSAISFTCLLQN